MTALTELVADSHKAFEGLIERLAAGEEPKKKEILATLAAVNRSTADLHRAVNLRRHLRELEGNWDRCTLVLLLCARQLPRHRERLAFWRSRNLLGNAKRFLAALARLPRPRWLKRTTADTLRQTSNKDQGGRRIPPASAWPAR